ncbi:M20/M25/M40 family metallo-hydrolase [Salipaludibacillus sp. CUR1]|uniref:M20 family metallopeptidase n=1 Tax=Salipaludibacillus sp. CUR1 TaxID=2820003 RepID=UPI001E57757A|nr:M20/M25/M40 family metallo-hydrolase [Salipaludibacillus sp. CUR1]MCE7791126.1 M20/M25/M40 family metallo-hydrolase [Salipaludibacillus sp. CUR1]
MGDPIPLLEDLIKIDSSTKDGANEAVNYCEKWLADRGLEVKSLRNNGYHMLVSEIGKGENTIVFNAHVDVVEGEEEQFRPFELDGKLYGRGAVDMKAGAAAMMETMIELKDTDLPCRVMLQVVPDEETGGANGTKYLTEQGYLGDFIICGEPTNLGIAIQSKGVVQLDFEINGKPAHGSRPWEGKNAIIKAMDLYERILELPFAQETAQPMFNKPSINLAKLNGGTVYNKVPEKCHMSLDIRYLPEQSPDEIIKQIEEITTDGKVSVHITNRPVTTKEDNPYVEGLVKSLQNKTQLETINIYGQHGSNDGQFFTKYGGAAVEFGPVGGDWHGEKEMVYIESVRQYQHVISDFVQSCSKERMENN